MREQCIAVVVIRSPGLSAAWTTIGNQQKALETSPCRRLELYHRGKLDGAPLGAKTEIITYH